MKETHKPKEETVLAQWQICVEMANSVSQRRDAMNAALITLNLAIIAASQLWEAKSIILLICGVAICVLWLFLINYYKKLNIAKFQVINELEKQLPFQPFNREWELLNKNKKHKEGTAIERLLPIVFLCMYIMAIVFIAIIMNKNVGGTSNGI